MGRIRLDMADFKVIATADGQWIWPRKIRDVLEELDRDAADPALPNDDRTICTLLATGIRGEMRRAEKAREDELRRAFDPPPQSTATTPARNAPCPCGSGVKAKKCCHR